VLFMALTARLLVQDYLAALALSTGGGARAAAAAVGGVGAAAAAAAPPTGLRLLAAALWAAQASRPGWLLLLALALPTLAAAAGLLARHALLAAANLTVNEWVNRSRYLYLNQDAGGYSNRFDRGPAANCFEFWALPGGAHRDYWEPWEAGDRVSLGRRGSGGACCRHGRRIRLKEAQAIPGPSGCGLELTPLSATPTPPPTHPTPPPPHPAGDGARRPRRAARRHVHPRHPRAGCCVGAVQPGGAGGGLMARWLLVQG
jgi:hypothetical protein